MDETGVKNPQNVTTPEKPRTRGTVLRREVGRGAGVIHAKRKAEREEREEPKNTRPSSLVSRVVCLHACRGPCRSEGRALEREGNSSKTSTLLTGTAAVSHHRCPKRHHGHHGVNRRGGSPARSRRSNHERHQSRVFIRGRSPAKSATPSAPSRRRLCRRTSLPRTAVTISRWPSPPSA